jgi:hypothetical protein
MCVDLGCDVTIVDSEPVWPQQHKRMVQIDMPTLPYLTLQQFAAFKESSVESLLHSWIEEHARPTVSDEGKRIHERCRLLKEWQSLGFAGKKAALRYFAHRLASA